MQFEVNQRVGSFRVTAIRSSEELHAQAVELRHEKTGCPVFWLNNGAENKVFSIAFRTLPDDDTGVFHILEHSVLCGSDKYPVREPFVELLKGSMNTFLNAMTFQDMTMYPVASRNNRDLLNLTEVYLDAVFRPRCVTDERVFRQEGWRLEPDPEGRYHYQGVVFNEMKGSMSDVETLGERQLNRMLFPDTAYGFNSGGDPEHIPDLTFDQFRARYLRHYHPSNAVIYLDGAVPMEEMLPLLASYLDTYDMQTDLPVAEFQTPVSSDEILAYELGPEEEEADRGHLYLGRILGTWRERVLGMAVSLIGEVLTGHNDAPLKRLILEKELAQDISLSVDGDGLQSFLILHAENVADGREEDLLREIRGFGDRLEKDGLDANAVAACMNRLIFHMKEEEEPQGIERAVRCMDIGLYGGDLLDALEFNPVVEGLRALVESGKLNRLAVSLFREQAGDCVLRLHPSKTLGEEKLQAEEARADRVAAAWTEPEKQAWTDLLDSLHAWQETPDSPEALATLPMLKKEDADVPPVWTETEDLRTDGVRQLRHLLPCNGIVYARALFSLNDLTAEQLADVAMLCSLYGKLPTDRVDALTLQQEVKRYTGRMSFSVATLSHPKDPARCAVMLCASVACLPENTEKALSLMAEILLRTDFSSDEKILEIAQQIEIGMRQRVISSGNLIAARSVLSHYSAEYVLKNRLEGDEAVRYVHDFARQPEQSLPALRAMAARLRGQSFCRQRALLSLTADQPIQWQPLLSVLPEGTPLPDYGTWTREAPLRQGYRIPAQVGYAVRGYHLSQCGFPFHGAMWLASSLLSLGYLWNQVRVRGGAYGAGFSIDRMGNMYSWSYRDPTPDRTLEVCTRLSEALREFVAGDESLDKYIISTLNDLNPLLSARDQGALADSRYLNGYTRDLAERIRGEILHATPEDILRFCDALDAFAEKGAVCVVAPGPALQKCPDLEVADL